MRVDAKCVSLEDLFDEAEEKYERALEDMMPNDTVDSYDMIVACMVGNMIAKAFEKKTPKEWALGKAALEIIMSANEEERR